MEVDAQHEREEWERLHDELVSMTSGWTAAQLQAVIRLIRECQALGALQQAEVRYLDDSLDKRQ